MRHHKHSNQLGVKKEHRIALMANLSAALIREGRIQTTLKKAKALRPFVERLITLAKNGNIASRRLAMSRVRDAAAIKTLFDERVGEFSNRQGGYTRIYKLGPQRRGDAAEMAIIEFVPADDPGYRGGRRRAKGKKSEGAAKAAAVAGEEKPADPAEEADPASGDEAPDATAQEQDSGETQSEAQPEASSSEAENKKAEGEAEEK